MRRVPLAAPVSSVVVACWPLGCSPPPHAARNDGPRVSAAAAAAPPPRNRRRVVRLAASRDRSRGSISLGMAAVPFVNSGERDGLAGTTVRCSSSISSRSSVVGISAAGSTREASGAQQTWTSSPGRSSGRSCSGPMWATIGESSGAPSDRRTTGPWKVRSRTVARTVATSPVGGSIDTRTRSGRIMSVAWPPGSIVVSPGRAFNVVPRTSTSTRARLLLPV